MKDVAIKTEWASLNLSEGNSVVVCAKSNGATHCTQFESLEVLKEAIGRKKVTVKKWAVAVSQSSCIIKPLAVPASDLDEAAKMVEFELASLVPLPADEIVYGCTSLGMQGNMLNVLVCILKLSTLNDYLEPCRVLGIEPHAVALDSLAMQSWFDTGAVEGWESVINVLLNETDYVVQTCPDRNFNKAKELAYSNGDIALSSEEILQEISRNEEEIIAPDAAAVGVLLAGAEERVSKVADALRSSGNRSAAPREVAILPMPKVVPYDGDGKLEVDANKFGRQVVVAAGLLELAASPKSAHCNLLPREFAKRHERKALLLKYSLTGSLCLAMILLVWLYLVTVNWKIGRVSRTIELQIAPIKDIAGSVENKRKRVEAVQRQLSSRGRITQIISELYKYTPSVISISELTYKTKGSGASITLKGQADSLWTAFNYPDAVKDANLLSDLQVPDAQQVPRPGGGSVIEFNAYCSLEDN